MDEETRSLIDTLHFNYWANRIAVRQRDPSYDESLWDWLIRHGIQPDDIWEYSPQIGWDAGQEEPDWL